MKKLLLSFVAMTFAICANAQEFTFDFNELSSYGLDASKFKQETQTDGSVNTFYELGAAETTATITNGDIIIKDQCPKGATTAKIWYYTDSKTSKSNYQYRTYKNHVITVSMKNGAKIVSIKGNGSTALNYAGDATSEVKVTLTATQKFNSLTVVTEGGDVPTTKEISVAEALEIAGALEDGAETTDEYIVSGKIASIKEKFGSYGNATFTLEGGLVCYRVYYLDNQKQTTPVLAVSDEVKVLGKLKKYGTTLEVVSGYIKEHKKNGTVDVPEEKGLTTVANFLAAKDNFNIYELEGSIVKCDATADGHTGHKFDLEKYGNFELKDATGSVYIFGLLDFDGKSQNCASMKLAEGDVIRLKGTYLTYNNIPQIKNAQIVKIVSSASINGVEMDSANAPAYNLAGQKVSAQYKGVVIKNGKKMLVK